MGIIPFIVSVVYTVAGLAAFIVFLLMRFYAASVFGFVTATISAVTAHINWLHNRRRLTLWYEDNELSQFFWLAFWTFALGFSGLVYHLVTYLVLQQYTTRMDLIVACIWGCITVKSSAMLMYYSNKYVCELAAPQLLINNDHHNDNTSEDRIID